MPIGVCDGCGKERKRIKRRRIEYHAGNVYLCNDCMKKTNKELFGYE